MRNSLFIIRKEHGEDYASGFALVIALSLMAFVLVLLLTISTLVQVESKGAQLTIAQLQARQNAYLALNVALGELQATAGPDQRVTARSDILAQNPISNGTSIEYTTPENPYYTLVWDVSGSDRVPADPASAVDADFLPQHDFDKKPAVLVSGNEKLNYDLTTTDPYPDDYVIESTSVDSDSEVSVKLVSAPATGTAASEMEQEIRAPWVTVDTDGVSNSRYGWWIGDEGIKARINIDAETERAVDGASDYEVIWQTPHRLKPDAIDTTLVGLDSSALERVFDNRSLSLVASGLSSNANYSSDFWHDFTYHSSSLPVDVRHGGLKKDLSYILGNTNGSSVRADVDYLFPRNLGGASSELNKANLANVNAAQWGVLRDFYSLATDAISGESLDMRYHRFGEQYDDTANFENGITPVLSHYQMGYSAYLESDPEDTTLQVLRMHYMPAVVLWNPYDFDLNFPDLVLSQAHSGGTGAVDILIAARPDGPTDGPVFPDGATDNPTWNALAVRIHSVSVNIPAGTIPAGQAMVYSAPYGDQQFELGSGGQIYEDSNRNYLESGFRANASFIDYPELKQYRKGDDRFTDGEVLQIPSGYNWLKMELYGGQGYEFYLGPDEPGELALWDEAGYRRQTEYLQTISNVAYEQLNPSGPDNQFFAATNPAPTAKHLSVVYMPIVHDPFGIGVTPTAMCAYLNPRAVAHATAFPQRVGDDGEDTPVNRVATYVGGYFADYEAESEQTVMTQTGSNGSGSTYIGSITNGIEEAVLYELPDIPFVSIAQLSHSNITGPIYVPAHNRRWTGSGDYLVPAYPIGSSFASPYITDLSEFTEYLSGDNGDSAARPYQVWDYSYLLNDALYDQYFFSSLPQDVMPSSDLLNGDELLVNPLYRIVGAPSEDDLLAADTAAKFIEVDAGFNVNSTSENAWTAFLSAFRDTVYDDLNDSGALFARLSEPTGQVLTDSELTMTDPDVYTGHRRLTDDEIQDLAERIVEQVKLRGPFPSMSAFVNRVIDLTKLRRDSTEFSASAPVSGEYPAMDLATMVQIKGPLQAALDLSMANDPFFTDASLIVDEDDSVGGMNPTGDEPNVSFIQAAASGLPGFLSQFDILSRLGSLMTVRSDTFVIRVAGQSLDPISNQVLATVYGEATVQRRVDFIDSSNAAEVENYDSTFTQVNQNFGRRFELISFRWLAPDDL
jgi:hypothetical protein